GDPLKDLSRRGVGRRTGREHQADRHAEVDLLEFSRAPLSLKRKRVQVHCQQCDARRACNPLQPIHAMKLLGSISSVLFLTSVAAAQAPIRDSLPGQRIGWDMVYVPAGTVRL